MQLKEIIKRLQITKRVREIIVRKTWYRECHLLQEDKGKVYNKGWTGNFIIIFLNPHIKWQIEIWGQWMLGVRAPGYCREWIDDGEVGTSGMVGRWLWVAVGSSWAAGASEQSHHKTVSRVSSDCKICSSLEHHSTSSSMVTTPSWFVSIN